MTATATAHPEDAAIAPVSDRSEEPVGGDERIVALDLIRGIAVLGILFPNIVAHGDAILSYFWPPNLPGGATPADKLFWLGQARGACISAAVLAELPVSEYTAMQVKQAVVGNGHAKKEQVQEMVKRLLCLAAAPSADAADALACAICHAHGGMGLGAIPTRDRRVKRGRLL